MDDACAHEMQVPNATLNAGGVTFSMNVLNTKVVDNFLILLFLKFHDLSPVGLGVIDFRSCCQVFACPLDRSE